MPNVGRNVRTSMYCRWKYTLVQPVWKEIWQIISQTKYTQTYDLPWVNIGISFLGLLQQSTTNLVA